MRAAGKRVLSWILLTGLLVTALPAEGFAAESVREEAWEAQMISTPQDFLEFARTVNEGDSFFGKKVVLTQDLDMAQIQMEAIGTEAAPFRGTFEGRGYTIRNLHITGGDCQGLFGVVQSGTIEGVNLAGAQIQGRQYIGGIVGSSSGTIKNCTFEGTVDGWDSVGGIAGVQTGGTITRCSSEGEITGTGNDTGGVLGKGNGGKTTLCSSAVRVTGGTGTCGGVAGYLNGTSVSDCYSKSDVCTTGANIGGIIGGIDGNSPVTSCYSSGTVQNTGTANEGGAVGWNRAGAVSKCYYNADLYTGRAIGSNESGGEAFGKTAEELRRQDTYGGFDFDAVWMIQENVNDGYPVFQAERQAAEKVEADFAWLTFDVIKGENENSQEVTENLKLPVKGPNGSKIYWTSSNPQALLDSGVKTADSAEGQDVTLTARITDQGVEVEKQFAVRTLPTGEEDRPLHILQIGDSNTEFARITQSMNQILKEEYGSYGDGFLTLCKDYINIAPENFSIEYGGHWYQYDLVYGAGELQAAQDTPFGLYAQSRSPGDTITVQFAGSAVDLYYLSWAGAGTFRVLIDGQDYGEVVQTSGEFVTKKAVYEGLSYGLHTMVIQNVSGVINFYGADYRVDEAVSRKNISTWGKAGIQAKQYAVDLNETVFKTALTQLNPDVVMILLGTNDNGWSACPADTLEGYLDTIIKRVKDSVPEAEIWVVSTFETANSKEILHSYWDTAFPQAAQKNGVHYWSMGEWFGPYTTKQMADGWHSNLQSSAKIAEKMYEVIQGGKDVVGRNIVSVETQEPLQAKEGTSFEQLRLPERVRVELDDLQHSKVWLDVDWSREGYQEDCGAYKLTGVLTSGEGQRIYNPEQWQAEIEVTLKEDYKDDRKLRLSYDFEGVSDGNIPDQAGNFTGKLHGNAKLGEGMKGTGITLPGDAESYISIPSQAMEDCSELTISTWIKLDKADTWTTLFSIGSEQTNYVVLAAAGAPGGEECGVTAAIMADAGAEYRIKAPADKKVPVGEWVQVAYTQAYGKARLYLNGELVAENDQMPVAFQDVVLAGGTQIRLGAANAWPDPAVRGSIEELKIYGKALSQEEIQKTITEKEKEINGEPEVSQEELEEAVRRAQEAQKEAENAQALADGARQEAQKYAAQAQEAKLKAQEAEKRAQELADASEAEREAAVKAAQEASEKAEEAEKKAQEAQDAAEKADLAAEAAKRAAMEAEDEAKNIRFALQKVKEEAQKLKEEAQAAQREADQTKEAAQRAKEAQREAMKALQIWRDAQKQESVQVGQVYKVGKLNYRVTDMGGRTVSVTGPVKKSVKKAEIPATVAIEGVKYQVTAIEAGAFKNCRKLREVTVGKHITSIGSKAFYKAGNLKKVILKTRKLEAVGKQALKGIFKKAVIRTPSGKSGAYKKILKKAGQPKTVRIKE